MCLAINSNKTVIEKIHPFILFYVLHKNQYNVSESRMIIVDIDKLVF